MCRRLWRSEIHPDQPARREHCIRCLRSTQMNCISRYALAVTLATVPAAPRPAAAQASPDLLIGSRVEWAVEKLVGFGLIDDRLVGVRPWSQREALRLLEQARANLTRLDAADREAAEGILSAIPEGRLTGKLHVDLHGDATVLDSPWAPVPTETGADRIDAEVNHLVRYRGGREFADGQTLGAEFGIEAVLNKHVSLQARPRLWIARDTNDLTAAEAQVLEAQARFQIRGLRVDVGRLGTLWGHGRNGGSLLTNNARGLDRVRISSDTPFRWPGPLSLLGPSQAEFFLARLESERDIPHSKLVGYTISIRPHNLVEASFYALIQSGGDGAPTAGFGERVADHLLFFDWLINRESDFLSSNKASSLALRVRIPALRNTQVFAEHTIEDPALNLERMFWQDAGWLVGIWVPRLDRAGVFDLRAEFHHGGVRFHRHGQFTSGRTLDRRMLGMGGPDTNGGFVEIAADSRRVRFSLELGVENRSADRWRAIIRDSGGIDVWEKVEDGPDELSVRGLGGFSTFDTNGRELSLVIGLEQVSDSFFVAAATRLNAILQVGAVLPLR